MTAFEKLEGKAMRLREALVKQAENQHHPAILKQLRRSIDDAEEIHARMESCRMLIEEPVSEGGE